jgi:hypothetical protein
MAFQTVSGQDGKLLSELKDGESVTAYLKDVVMEKNKKFNSDAFNLIMVDQESGKEFKLLTGGTATYVAKNIAEARGMIPADRNSRPEDAKRDAQMVGCLVRITRNGGYVNKTGKQVTKYTFECDPEQKLF